MAERTKFSSTSALNVFTLITNVRLELRVYVCCRAHIIPFPNASPACTTGARGM